MNIFEYYLEVARRNWKRSHTEEHRIALQNARETYDRVKQFEINRISPCVPIPHDYNSSKLSYKINGVTNAII
jgi:hypothetical protein